MSAARAQPLVLASTSAYRRLLLERLRIPFESVAPAVDEQRLTGAGGGFSLALACDFRVMSEGAALRQAYTSNGLCIDGGGSHTLPRLVGMARAMEIMAFDRPISSEQALSWGLVTRVVQDGSAREEALGMARELVTGSLHSFGWSKRLLTDSFNSSFETHIEQERRGLSGCAAHPEGKEGLLAFAEKRKPQFKPGPLGRSPQPR